MCVCVCVCIECTGVNEEQFCRSGQQLQTPAQRWHTGARALTLTHTDTHTPIGAKGLRSDRQGLQLCLKLCLPCICCLLSKNSRVSRSVCGQKRYRQGVYTCICVRMCMCVCVCVYVYVACTKTRRMGRSMSVIDTVIHAYATTHPACFWSVY